VKVARAAPRPTLGEVGGGVRQEGGGNSRSHLRLSVRQNADSPILSCLTRAAMKPFVDPLRTYTHNSPAGDPSSFQPSCLDFCVNCRPPATGVPRCFCDSQPRCRRRGMRWLYRRHLRDLGARAGSRMLVSVSIVADQSLCKRRHNRFKHVRWQAGSNHLHR